MVRNLVAANAAAAVETLAAVGETLLASFFGDRKVSGGGRRVGGRVVNVEAGELLSAPVGESTGELAAAAGESLMAVTLPPPTLTTADYQTVSHAAPSFS